MCYLPFYVSVFTFCSFVASKLKRGKMVHPVAEAGLTFGLVGLKLDRGRGAWYLALFKGLFKAVRKWMKCSYYMICLL